VGPAADRIPEEPCVNRLTVNYLNRPPDLLLILSQVVNTDSHGGTGDILRMPGGEDGERTPEGDGAAARPRRPQGGVVTGETAG
jgi:hypothetical protein